MSVLEACVILMMAAANQASLREALRNFRRAEAKT
jgi:hypothetical protein